MSGCVWRYTESTFQVGWQRKKKGFRRLFPAFTFDCQGIWGRFSIRFSLSGEVWTSRGGKAFAIRIFPSSKESGGERTASWRTLQNRVIDPSALFPNWSKLESLQSLSPYHYIEKKWKLTSNRSFFLLAWDWMLIMKSITIPSRSRAFTSRSNGTMRDSLVNRLQQGMAFRVWTRGEICLHR